uniref:C2H2-type domain-containing protein n=1 Tax=Kryptolebias marmoratus TaxID=37003 RepID=A0A3Q3ARM0_KRYMA
MDESCEEMLGDGANAISKPDTAPKSDTPPQYVCPQCNMWFTNKAGLTGHQRVFSSSQHFLRHLENHANALTEIISEGKPSEGLICPVCHLCFASATELIHHFPTHPDTAPDGEKRQLGPSGSELEKQELLHPTSASEYECTKCGGTFLGGDAFHRHRCSQQQQATMETKYPTVTSPTRQAPGEEEEVDVTGEDLYTCNECSMQFSSKSALLEHQNTHHSNGKQFICDHCGKTFAKRSYLRNAAELRTVCTRCGNSFASRCSLRRHISWNRCKGVRAAANPPKTFNCSHCNADFPNSISLLFHQRNGACKPAIKPVRCPVCLRWFGTMDSLQKHLLTHKQSESYRCDVCQGTYPSLKSLKIHRRRIHRILIGNPRPKTQEPLTF